jgi:hypothetical protein
MQRMSIARPEDHEIQIDEARAVNQCTAIRAFEN